MAIIQDIMNVVPSWKTHTDESGYLKAPGQKDYHQKAGYNFKENFPNTPTYVADALAKAYQYGTEGIGSLFTGRKDWKERAKEEARLNSLGFRGQGFNMDEYNQTMDFARTGDTSGLTYGSAQAGEPNKIKDTQYDWEGNFRGSNRPDWWGKREFNPVKYNQMKDTMDRYNYPRVAEDTSDLSGMAEVKTPTAQKFANLDKFTRSPHQGFGELDKWGNRRMALEKEDFYEAPSGLASLMKDFKTKTGEGWDFAKQVPGMAISALSGIPGLGFLLSSIKPDPRDKYLGDPYSMQNYRGRNYGYGNTLRHGNLKGQDQFGINTRSLFGDYQGHYGKFMNNYLAGNIKKNKFNKAKYDFAQEVTGTNPKTSPNITGTPLITSTSIHQGPDTPQGGNWGAAPGTPGGWDPGARKDGGRIGYKTGGLASLWPR